MKHRWIAALMLAAALSLGACAPQQGTDGSAEPTTDPTPTMEATPDSYEY